MILRALGLSLLLCATAAQAAIDTYEFRNDHERERFRELTSELRCPKCQNQNIADSDAPIAMDLRREIFRMFGEGKRNDEIISYLYRVEPQPTYMPEEDFFREAPDMQELGPDELGAIVNQSGLDGIHRVLRFSAGGVDEDEPDPRR